MITAEHTGTPALALPWTAPAISPGRETLQRAGDRLWRVIDEKGTIRGHLRLVADPLGIRYRAERLRAGTGSFLLVGEFWDADDAVAALRF
ncbi:hypothetical protein DY023_12500 [Microbacterium bovistercoris]|uniref:DNA mismatch repair protein n=1 Tax=Microbacterium bovistercoris TaxID=2293570 RepID=A0A371NRF2_9MICO|nr:hypothetical protein [Microbacterium bovistercoris]REJ04736.1 hypothetical protein DY023_12500 [Microbacterium bovistercoris]